MVTDTATHNGSSARARLPSLLVERNGGRPLDLAVVAAISADTASATSSLPSSHPHAANLSAIIAKLFRDHAGESPEVLVENGLRHARDDVERTTRDFSRKQKDKHCRIGGEDFLWFGHPENRYFRGPRTEGWVWVELFLGRERRAQLLGECDAKDTGADSGSETLHAVAARYRAGIFDYGPDGREDMEKASAVLKALEGEAASLPALDLLSNILRYVHDKALNCSREQLMRFAILYGLDGVVKEVLSGKYGNVTGGLSINSLFPLDTDPLPTEGNTSYHDAKRMFFPCYAFGAVLGYVNIVKMAKDIGGEMDAPFGIQRMEDEAMQVNRDHTLPSHVFLWALSKNMPEIITCLVKDCEYQFRWTRERHIDLIFERLFDAVQWEIFPKYRGDMEEPDFESAKTDSDRRSMCRMQAASAYRPQMQMLDFLIALGFPFELFFPRDPQLELEERLFEEGKLDTRQACGDYVIGLPEDVRKVRARVHRACSDYNWIQGEETKTMTFVGFYRALKSRWDGQMCPQILRIPEEAEEEALDSMWRKGDIPFDGIIHDSPFRNGRWHI